MNTRRLLGVAGLLAALSLTLAACSSGQNTTSPTGQGTSAQATTASSAPTQQVAGAQATKPAASPSPAATAGTTGAGATPSAALATPMATSQATPSAAMATGTAGPTSQAAPGAGLATPGATTAQAPAAPYPPLPKVSGTVRVMGVWGGDELNAFRQVIAGWEQQTGGKVEFEGTRDLTAVLRARVSGGNPPDIAILPNPALMQEFAKAGKLQSLDQGMDMSRFQQDYSKAWQDLGTTNGKLYGLFIKAVTKDTVWYNPQAFQAGNYQVPKSWDDLINLSNQMVKDGKAAPWSIGMEAGAASGWPGSDWVQEIYLHESGPEMYDKWVAHQIPWTDPSVKSAFQKFGQLATSQGYVPGGAQAILATNFTDAAYLPFMNPPKAYMYFLGAFTQTSLQQQFPQAKAGQDYNFFPFVSINSQYAGSVTGGADVAVMFTATDASKSFMQYMARATSWEPWAKAGGYTSPNKSFNISVYPDQVAQNLAKQLTDAPTFRFDADDTMPAQVQQAEFRAVIEFLRNPGQVDSILQNMETTAKDAYKTP